MGKDTNTGKCITRILRTISISSIPFIYTILSRARPQGPSYVRGLFYEYLIVFFATLFSVTLSLSAFAIDFASAFILLYLVYEILYIANDISAYREDVPTYRRAVNEVNIYVAIIGRTLIFIVFIFLNQYLMEQISNVLIWCLLLLFSGAIHNSIKEKPKRMATFALMRLTRYTFIPAIVGGFLATQNTLIAILPYLLLVMVGKHTMVLERKIGISLPQGNVSFILSIGSFLPLQLVLLGFSEPCILCGNYILVALSTLKMLYTKFGQ